MAEQTIVIGNYDTENLPVSEFLKQTTIRLKSGTQHPDSIQQEILYRTVEKLNCSKGLIAYLYREGGACTWSCRYSPHWRRYDIDFSVGDATDDATGVKNILNTAFIECQTKKDISTRDNKIIVPFYNTSNGYLSGAWVFYDNRKLSESDLLDLELIRAETSLQLEIKEKRTLKNREFSRKNSQEKEKRLLEAILQVQSRFLLQEYNRYQLFMLLLNEVLALTESDYGFFGDVDFETETNRLRLTTWACTEMSWNQETRIWFRAGYQTGLRLYKLDSLYGPIMAKGEVVISNDPKNDPRGCGIPPGHPPLTSFLGVPIKSNNKVVGALCLGNRVGGYTIREIQIIESFVVSYAIMVVATRDRESRAQAEKALKLAKEEADRSSKIKTEILQNTSHELRTPLNAITGFIDVLTGDGSEELSTNQKKIIRHIKRSADSLLEKVENILSYSRMSSGSDVPNPIEKFILTEALNEVGNILLNKASKKGLGLVLQMSADTPSTVIGHRSAFCSILLNLGENAIKFSEKGHVAFQLSIAKIVESSITLRVRVSDTGIGIPSEHFNTIFEPFAQLHVGNSRKYHGTGLGLSIIREYLKKIGGSISVESEINKGSCFTVEIPLKLEDGKNYRPQSDEFWNDITPNLSEMILNPTKKKLKSQKKRSLKKQILPKRKFKPVALIVDDNRLNCVVLSQIINKLGIETVSAGNGAEAVDICSKTDFDIIFMDLAMPIMDGYEATRKIRKMRNQTALSPIIAVSANVEAEENDKFFSSGMDDYLTKPISMLKVQTLLRKHNFEIGDRSVEIPTVAGDIVQNKNKSWSLLDAVMKIDVFVWIIWLTSLTLVFQLGRSLQGC